MAILRTFTVSGSGVCTASGNPPTPTVQSWLTGTFSFLALTPSTPLSFDVTITPVSGFIPGDDYVTFAPLVPGAANWNQSIIASANFTGGNPLRLTASLSGANGAYNPATDEAGAVSGFGSKNGGTYSLSGTISYYANAAVAFVGEPGGGLWFAAAVDELRRRLWQGWRPRPSGVLVPA